MERIFELYDCVVNEHVSYHNTMKGALEAMRDAIDKLIVPLCRDYEEDGSKPPEKYRHIDFTLQYQIKTHPVKE